MTLPARRPGLSAPFTALLAAVAAATITTGRAGAERAPAAPALTLDGARVAAAVVVRSHAAPLVAIEPLAVAAGWRIARTAAGALAQGDDHVVALAVASRAVRDNGETRVLFAEPLSLRDGRLFLSASDAARLFSLRVARSDVHAVELTHPVQIGTEPDIRDVARPATPRPSATPRPLRRAGAAAAGRTSAGRVVLSVERSGGTRVVQLTSQTQGGELQTMLSASGVNALGAPNATVVVGSADRSAGLGMLTDPLSGLIFRGGIYDGASLQDGVAHRTVFAGRRVADGLSMAGVTAGDALHGGANTVAAVFRGTAYDQTIVRRLTVQRHPWGDFTEELIAGDRGVGAAIAARTRGRTFVESSLALASHGLPLGPNDAPVIVDVGRDLSTVTTVVGGFSTGPGQPAAPFAGISTRRGALRGSISLSDRTVTTSFSFEAPRGNAQFYAVPGAQRTMGLQGTLELAAATVELASTSAQGARETSLLMRTARPGVNLVAGLGEAPGSRIGPIAGLSVPIGPLLAIEGTTRPSAGGQRALRLALAVGIPGRRAPRVATLPARLRIAGPASVRAVRLFVDGDPVRTVTGADASVDVTPGPHAFSVESVDGAFGSQAVTADVQAAGDGVTLALYPQRVVSGRVRLADAHAVGSDFRLGGITVIVSPGDVTAETRDDGTFSFPKQPFPGDAVVRVDPQSLPRELRAPDGVPLANDVELVLAPGLRIERQSFGANGAASAPRR